MRPEPPYGTPRRFGPLVAACVLTLGVWWGVYHFAAFRELDRQMGRRHSALFFLAFVPVLGILFGALYAAREIRHLREDRAARGLAPGITVQAYLLWSLPGAFLLLAGPFVALHGLVRSLNGLWWHIYQDYGAAWPEGHDPGAVA